MDASRVTLVALLVVLAGCGVLGGGGGGGTPTAPPGTDGPDGTGPFAGGSGTTAAPTAVPGTTAPGTSPGATTAPETGAGSGTDTGTTTAPTPTGTADTPAAPTPGTPTDTPTPTGTPTPFPPGVEQGTFVNGTLGVSLTLVGNATVVSNAQVSNVTGSWPTRGAILGCARASPFVGAVTNGTVADATVAMDYDPSMLPPNASESELSVFVYNKTVNFYLEMETTVDAANDTATGTRIASGQTFRREAENGTQRISPKLDGTRLDNAFVVMHAPTYWEAVESGQVPERCQRATPTPVETATQTPGETATVTPDTTANGTGSNTTTGTAN